MNGAGQTLTAFSTNLINENNVIISIHDDDDQVENTNPIITVVDAATTLPGSTTNRLLKSNSVSSSCTLTSSSTYSIQADDSVPFLNQSYFECIICLNKLNDVDEKNQIFQIKSCRCKFCVNVS